MKDYLPNVGLLKTTVVYTLGCALDCLQVDCALFAVESGICRLYDESALLITTDWTPMLGVLAYSIA